MISDVFKLGIGRTAAESDDIPQYGGSGWGHRRFHRRFRRGRWGRWGRWGW